VLLLFLYTYHCSTGLGMTAFSLLLAEGSTFTCLLRLVVSVVLHTVALGLMYYYVEKIVIDDGLNRLKHVQNL
jgi:hypothetical protein